MIINTANLTSIFTNYKDSFKTAFERAETDWDRIATMIPSSTEISLYAWLGQFPKLREWLGSRVIKNMVANDYSLTNKDFEATIAVKRTKILDDTFGVFSPLFAEMGFSAKLHPDELVFTELAAGATNLCYDGQPFFNASHPTVVDEVASTASNYDVTGGGNLWALMDTKRPLKPLIWQKRQEYNFQTFQDPRDQSVFMNNEYVYGVDGRSVAGYGLWQMAYGSLNTLNGTNVDNYIETMMALKSDEGKPLGIKPDLLVCGPSNWAEARDLMELSRLSNGASNPHFQMMKVLVSPQMT